MARPYLTAALIAAIAAPLVALPAAAQFGILFGDPPPRPPGSVPGRQQQQQQQPQDLRPPGQELPPFGQGPGAGVQSQPLPPPSGGAQGPNAGPQDILPQQSGLPPAEPGAQPAPSRLPPGQRQPRGTPQPTNTAPQPGDEVVTGIPAQKIVNPTAVFAGLDKITGRIISFDVAIGETVQFGALQVTPRACYTRPPTEASNTDSFVEVDEVTLQGEVRRIFTGWMFASSPGLHAVEHPIYDIWLSDCKGGATVTAAAPATDTPPPQQRPAQQRQQQQRPAQARPAQPRPTQPPAQLQRPGPPPSQFPQQQSPQQQQAPQPFFR